MWILNLWGVQNHDSEWRLLHICWCVNRQLFANTFTITTWHDNMTIWQCCVFSLLCPQVNPEISEQSIMCNIKLLIVESLILDATYILVGTPAYSQMLNQTIDTLQTLLSRLQSSEKLWQCCFKHSNKQAEHMARSETFSSLGAGW